MAAEHRPFGQRTDLGRTFSWTRRRAGSRADAHPPGWAWGHRFFDARSQGEPARLRRGRLLAGPSPAALRVAGLDQPEPDQVRRPRRKDDRDDRHRRHAGVVRRAAGLLPITRRHDGTGAARRICPALRDAAGGTRAEREKLRIRRRRQGCPGRADSQHVRQAGPARGLGRAQGRAGNGCRRDGRREEPAALLVSDLPAVHGRPSSDGGVVQVSVTRTSLPTSPRRFGVTLPHGLPDPSAQVREFHGSRHRREVFSKTAAAPP